MLYTTDTPVKEVIEKHLEDFVQKMRASKTLYPMEADENPAELLGRFTQVAPFANLGQFSEFVQKSVGARMLGLERLVGCSWYVQHMKSVAAQLAAAPVKKQTEPAPVVIPAAKAFVPPKSLITGFRGLASKPKAPPVSGKV